MYTVVLCMRWGTVMLKDEEFASDLIYSGHIPYTI